YVKVYEEERELTVMLLVDVSGSRLFGAEGVEKREMIAEIAATLAFSASQNNDKIGVIFFSSQIEIFIPPKKGLKHILYIIRELLDFKPAQQGTDIGGALKFLTDALKKRCTTFIISDFINAIPYRQPLSIASRKHDVTAVQVYDRRDTVLPSVGLMRVRDLESGGECWVDTSSKRVRQAYGKWWYERQQQMVETVNHCGVDLATVATDEDYVKALMGLFKHRGVKQ
ncbi:MAG: VWA domain-containing protein, partial [Muribaculaceae bacterium]|nr:VWA domain-containing protein [Muribaculaceae bacterium]